MLICLGEHTKIETIMETQLTKDESWPAVTSPRSTALMLTISLRNYSTVYC